MGDQPTPVGNPAVGNTPAWAKEGNAMNDGTLTITEFLASCGHGRGPRFLGPKIDSRDDEANARFKAADEKLLTARLALADAEEELYGRSAGELRGLAIETHHRHHNARQGRQPTP